MKHRNKRRLCISLTYLGAFLLWTVAVTILDVQPIGPGGSAVGLAAVNGFFHRLTGVHILLYHLTDRLSVIPLAAVMGFGILGLTQWIRRRRLSLVDRDLLLLGGFYLIVLTAFVFFEVVVINCRPVLIEGVLEASYPSSTTMLVLCVMPTAVMQLNRRLSNRRLCRFAVRCCTLFTGLMVFLRLLSGVHWLTDIVGGILLSAGLVSLYAAALPPKH